MQRRDAWRLSDLDPEYLWCGMADLAGNFPKERFDVLVNCAAVTDVAYAERSPRYAAGLTTAGLDSLYTLAKTGRVGHVVQISTHSVYGPPQKIPVTEEHPTHPSSVYGALKLHQESMLRAASAQSGVPLTVLRMSLMYGSDERTGALVSTFLQKALSGGAIQLQGGGEQTRDFLHVADAVKAVSAAVDSAIPGTFNVCAGENVSIRRLAELAVEFAGRDFAEAVVMTPARGGEEGRLVLSGDRARASGLISGTIRLEAAFPTVAAAVKERWKRGTLP